MAVENDIFKHCLKDISKDNIESVKLERERAAWMQYASPLPRLCAHFDTGLSLPRLVDLYLFVTIV